MAGSAVIPTMVALPGTAASGVVWRHRGKLRVTVIAKATFAIVDGGPMTPAAPQPIRTAELHHGKLPNRSIREAIDLAPRRDRVDVVLTGHAYSPGGRAAGAMVRLAVLDGERARLDKSLRVVDAAGFEKMPLVYERAIGGIGRADNPLGSEEPNILDPASPGSPAGFGPISRSWQGRRKLLGDTPRKAIDAPVAELPDDFDFSYFQIAPADQRVEELRGDERVVLEGMHPRRATVRAQLPGVRGAARIDGLAGAGIADGTWIELRIASLLVDADEQRSSVVLQGSFEVPDEAAVRAARVLVGVAPASAIDRTAAPPAAGASPRADAPARAAAPRFGADGTALMAPSDGTLELGESDLETTETSVDFSDADTLVRGERRPAKPAARPASGAARSAPLAARPSPSAAQLDDEPPETTPIPVQLDDMPPETTPIPVQIEDESQPTAPVPVMRDGARPVLPFRGDGERPPAARAVIADGERPPARTAIAEGKRPPARAAIADEETAGPDDQLLANIGATLPFQPDAEPSIPEAAAPPPPREPTDTVYLQPEEQESAADRSVLPFITTGRAEPAAGGKARRREPEPFVPARSSDAIPIVTSAPLVAWTLPWQVRAGRDVRTLVVKGTFDIVPGGPAKPRLEPDPPSGDVHDDGDAAKDLRYPSDFAIFKPKADVTLRGHAHAPGGSAPAVEVGLRFGLGEGGFERTIAVLGDRWWRGSSASKAAPFDRIPLVYSRAYGGPDFEANPIGRGRAAGPDGRIALPNLESRDDLIRDRSSAPAPVCLGPVPPSFQARAARLGTFGADWVKERWPYFPDDFDWAYFQAAPPEQQIVFPSGDESFSVWGVRPDAARVSSKLPGLAPRAFVQRTTEAGGLFFEVVLRLDTVVIDADAMTLTLVWRGLFDVAGAAASDVAEIYLMAARTAEPPIDLAAARARHRAERGPWTVVPETPETVRAANAGPPRRDPAVPDAPAIVAARLQAAGLAAPARAGAGADVGGASAASPAPSGGSSSGAASASEPPPEVVAPRAPRHDAALRAEVEARLARRATLGDLDLAEVDLSGIDFSGATLEQIVFKGASLAGCKLAGADLSGAVLAGADLHGAVLAGCKLTGADLTGAQLEEANLDEADLTAADLSGARAESASFRKARGAAPRFTGAELSRARFDGAELRGVDLTRAALDGAVLDDVRAPALRLYGARGTQASFERADLADARADGAILTRCSFAGASAGASVWDGASLAASSFAGADLAGAAFTRASCTGAVFAGATLTGAQLDGATLARASLTGANLMGASLQGADLGGADLTGANLHAAGTWQAKIAGAKLDRAITTGTTLPRGKR